MLTYRDAHQSSCLLYTSVMNAMDKIEKASKLHGTVTGIATGFIDLDYRTAGMPVSYTHLDRAAHRIAGSG